MGFLGVDVQVCTICALHIYNMEGMLNCKNNRAFIILSKSWFIATSVSSRITPQQTKVLTEKKPRTYLLVTMAENEEREVKEVLDEVDEL